jgi:hypothetical protein
VNSGQYDTSSLSASISMPESALKSSSVEDLSNCDDSEAASSQRTVVHTA